MICVCSLTDVSFPFLQIDNLKEAVNKSGNGELVQNFNRIDKFLTENGHIVDKVKILFTFMV